MHVLKPQNLPNLPITQRRLPLAHLPRHFHTRTHRLQNLPRRHPCRNRIIRRIKHLKPQPTLRHTPIANLPQIPCIDIAPRIALPRLWRLQIAREIARILVRLDHIADAQRIDIHAVAAGETARGALAAQLGGGVRVGGIDVVVLVEGEGVVVGVAVGEADAVDGLGAGDDDFAHAELAGGFDDVVGAEDVAAEGFAVRDEHVAGVGGEVDDGVGGAGGVGEGVFGHGEEGGEGVEGLAAGGEVGFEGVDVGVVEGD